MLTIQHIPEDNADKATPLKMYCINDEMLLSSNQQHSGSVPRRLWVIPLLIFTWPYKYYNPFALMYSPNPENILQSLLNHNQTIHDSEDEISNTMLELNQTQTPVGIPGTPNLRLFAL